MESFLSLEFLCKEKCGVTLLGHFGRLSKKPALPPPDPAAGRGKVEPLRGGPNGALEVRRHRLQSGQPRLQ